MAWASHLPGSCCTGNRLVHDSQHSAASPGLVRSSGALRKSQLRTYVPVSSRKHLANGSRQLPVQLLPAAMAPAAPPPITAAHTPAASTAACADPCLDLHGTQARSVGSLIGAMCGNALGAQVEPEKHYRLARLFPDGYHDMSWSFDLSTNPLPPGHVTGDFITMLAVAWSLVRRQQAEPFDMLDCLASTYSPFGAARYSPYTELTLEGLVAGTNPFLLAKHVEGFMAVTPSRASQSCSHRPDRQLHGTDDFTGVIRAVPIGIAYRDAPADVLRSAVDAVVAFTHPTEKGSEGAVAIAAAVGWLCKADPATATPEQLLEHLLAVSAQSPEMTEKLKLLQQRLPAMHDLGEITSWRQFWASAHWSHFVNTANLLWKQNLAMQGTQAAALALWVTLVSWRQPKQAVMLAASLGGYAATTGALVGAMIGALHGSSWVPQQWWHCLQDDPQLSSQDGDEAEQTDEHAAAVTNVSSDVPADALAVSEDEDPMNVLRVGKYAVAVLGNELAAVNAQQVPPLFS